MIEHRDNFTYIASSSSPHVSAIESYSKRSVKLHYSLSSDFIFVTFRLCGLLFSVVAGWW